MPKKITKKDNIKSQKATDKELQDLLDQAKKEADKKDGKEKVEDNECEKKIKNLEDALKRSQAEMVNFRQRTEKDKEDFKKYATKSVILEILPVLDTFQMAINHTPEGIKNDNWVVGVCHIKSQFEQSLEQVGVKHILTVGKKIDYDLHEAVAQVEGEKDIIVKELFAGYSLNGVVIRTAKVEVGKG